jgi:prefoldin subunit 4
MQTRLQTCTDAVEEAEICLDAEGMLLTVGESFFQVSEEEAIESLEKAKKLTEEALGKLVEESEQTRLEMNDLKKILYGKFGTSINLEDK